MEVVVAFALVNQPQRKIQQKMFSFLQYFWKENNYQLETIYFSFINASFHHSSTYTHVLSHLDEEHFNSNVQLRRTAMEDTKMAKKYQMEELGQFKRQESIRQQQLQAQLVSFLVISFTFVW